MHGIPFRKGNRYGKGRPKEPAELQLLRDSSRKLVTQWIIDLSMMDLPQLIEIGTSKSEPSIKMLIASAMVDGIQTGSFKHLELFLNRLVGKPVDHVEMSGPEGKPIQTEAVDRLKKDLFLLLSKREPRVED